MDDTTLIVMQYSLKRNQARYLKLQRV